MPTQIGSEKAPEYVVNRGDGAARTNVVAQMSRDDRIIAEALHILDERLTKAGDVMDSPTVVRQYVRLRLQEKPSEVFGVMLLDTRHQLIAYINMFYGTIDGASVHPREIVRKALKHNAAALILVHNHPSGVAEPSHADRALTRRLVEALGLIDVRVLDHLIVGGADVLSFAERGLL